MGARTFGPLPDSTMSERVSDMRQARRWTLGHLAPAAGVTGGWSSTSSRARRIRVQGRHTVDRDRRRARSVGSRHRPARRAGLWDWTLGPGDHRQSEAHHPRDQGAHPGARRCGHPRGRGPVLKPQIGDAVSLPGDVAHGYAYPKAEVARFTLTVFAPGVGPPQASTTSDPSVHVLVASVFAGPAHAVADPLVVVDPRDGSDPLDHLVAVHRLGSQP